MKTYTLDLPTLYGDHHVTEVRRILLALPGVAEVYASSAFQVIEVTYDPEKVTPQAVDAALAEYGYAGELEIPVEMGKAGYLRDDVTTYFRRTAFNAVTQQLVSFGQQAGTGGRPLWNCPGVGVLKTKMEE